jgi:hypothetical protein
MGYTQQWNLTIERDLVTCPLGPHVC